MTLALLASAASGCLITDPIPPADDSGNTNPSFFRVEPDNDSTVFIANTTTLVTFTAKASDAETPLTEIDYEWTIDNGPIVLEGADATQFQTNGATLGAGVHIITVLATDDDLPTGFATLDWEVQVQ